ncbi:MAG: FHA domain-containing protein [Proteobacteria bacterium]|nr:FHA domain-containing protein [Pseudomonadota bacterium]
MPAIATRCRMCGTQFDKKAEAKAEESPVIETKNEVEAVEPVVSPPVAENSSVRNRVRQRTVSDSSSEIKEIKKQLSSKLVENDYVPPVKEEPKSETRLSDTKKSQYEDLLADDVEDDLPIIEEEQDESGYFEPEGKEEISDNGLFEEKSQHLVHEEEPQLFAEDSKIEEHVSIKKFTDDIEREAEEEVRAYVPPKKVSSFEVENLEKKVIMEQHSVEENSVTSKAKVETTSARPSQIAEGVLFGWMVSFINDTRGVAMEIRSGKFFLGRQKLRSSDVIIQDTSVSTPHCMITADPAGGMQIQDLMSEKGTFVKKAGSNSFTQVVNVMNVSHGDWLKLGDYEVMVSLMPTVK